MNQIKPMGGNIIIYESNLHIGKVNRFLLPFTMKAFVSNKYLEGIPKKYKNDIIISYDMFDSKLFKSFWSNMIKYNVKNITFLYKEGYSDAIQ